MEAAAEVVAEQCAELEHLRCLPKACAAAAAEVVRRRAIVDELTARLRAVGSDLGRMRADEAEARGRSAPWLPERPPRVEIRCFPRRRLCSPSRRRRPPTSRRRPWAAAAPGRGGCKQRCWHVPVPRGVGVCLSSIDCVRHPSAPGQGR